MQLTPRAVAPSSPTVAAAARRPHEALGLSPPVLPASKIMLVDDEVVNIKLARKYLALAGYTNFVVATDSTEVMSLLDREQPDLLVLDIMMPKVSGLEILQDLRGQARYATLPVMILTAS